MGGGEGESKSGYPFQEKREITWPVTYPVVFKYSTKYLDGLDLLHMLGPY